MINFDNWRIYKNCNKRQKAIQMEELERIEKGYYSYKESDPARAGVYLQEMLRLITVYELPYIGKDALLQSPSVKIKKKYKLHNLLINDIKDQ